MPTESVSLSLLSVISLLSFFVVLMINKFSTKIGNGALLDQDFDKPQAFHKESVARSGGLAGIISLTIFFVLHYFLFQKILVEYLILSIVMFLTGFSEDIKLNIRAIYRLILMIVILLLFIIFFSISINSIDLIFLNVWMSNNIFMAIFILLCFLFIINGANLIDGFNGLLTIHLLIINSILLFINLDNNHQTLTTVITAQIVILLSFLLFNFPKAKMFLGDSGSYLFGSLVALNIINTNNLNPQISSFFFCILLFYLFFEVFFSFFRKIYQRKSPVLPDNEHLHMLSFIKISEVFGANKGNYINSIFINFIFCILVLPSAYFADNGLICKYWFFSLILIYTLIYIRLYRLTKN